MRKATKKEVNYEENSDSDIQDIIADDESEEEVTSRRPSKRSRALASSDAEMDGNVEKLIVKLKANPRSTRTTRTGSTARSRGGASAEPYLLGFQRVDQHAPTQKKGTNLSNYLPQDVMQSEPHEVQNPLDVPGRLEAPKASRNPLLRSKRKSTKQAPTNKAKEYPPKLLVPTNKKNVTLKLLMLPLSPRKAMMRIRQQLGWMMTTLTIYL